MSANRLGRGIKALIRPTDEVAPVLKPGAAKIPIKVIAPNPHQPRQQFDEISLEELAASIKEKGVLTPITVQRTDDHYVLIAGARRLRATQMAGLSEIPAYNVEVTGEADMMEMALIENIQRENLNPIEEAEAYAFLNSKFNLSQQKIAQAVGKKRVTITNALRLLNLPQEIKVSLRNGTISAGHGRAILMMKTTSAMFKLWKIITGQALSVRAAEASAQAKLKRSKPSKTKKPKTTLLPQVRVLEDELISILGTKVKIKTQKQGGMIEVFFFSNEDLDRILDLLRSIEK